MKKNILFLAVFLLSNHRIACMGNTNKELDALKMALYLAGGMKNSVGGKRLFECHVCGNKYKKRSALESHMVVHRLSNAIRFKCPHKKCEFHTKGFGRKDVFGRHMEERHGESRPHHCTICGQRFKRADHLKGHVARHNGDYKFKCPHSGCKYAVRGFVRRDELDRHEIYAHWNRGRQEDS